MKIIDFVSIAIMTPVMLYGSITLFFLSGWLFYFIFRRATIKDLKDTIKSLRLSDSFIAETKKLFWFTYTPLFAIVIVFRLAIPLNVEKYEGYLFAAITGYLLTLLFSGYISTKKNKDNK